jgi:hypothetical protein
MNDTIHCRELWNCGSGSDFQKLRIQFRIIQYTVININPSSVPGSGLEWLARSESDLQVLNPCGSLFATLVTGGRLLTKRQLKKKLFWEGNIFSNQNDINYIWHKIHKKRQVSNMSWKFPKILTRYTYCSIAAWDVLYSTLSHCWQMAVLYSCCCCLLWTLLIWSDSRKRPNTSLPQMEHTNRSPTWNLFTWWRHC